MLNFKNIFPRVILWHKKIHIDMLYSMWKHKALGLPQGSAYHQYNNKYWGFGCLSHQTAGWGSKSFSRRRFKPLKLSQVSPMKIIPICLKMAWMLRWALPLQFIIDINGMNILNLSFSIFLPCCFIRLCGKNRQESESRTGAQGQWLQ